MAIGAIAGAVVSGGSEYVKMNERKKAAARAESSAEFGGARPKHRKIARMGKAMQEALSGKQRALIAMAQAHQNYASSF
ncbi:hypothetical protein LCGC14_1663420 [marine sediment metagenome]|uniref:Uncharacterized protein n=1 Tax=marine sediment metagenome TaxID=412755 RepID=A0A0F9IFY8_9ZZZZ